MIIDVGVAHGFWPKREIVTTPSRYRPGASDVMALRVGYDKLWRETGWRPRVSWDSGVYQTIRWYAEHRSRWIGRVDWQLRDARSHARAGR
jgi:dTDP-glucose 4,6-dehydratase